MIDDAAIGMAGVIYTALLIGVAGIGVLIGFVVGYFGKGKRR